ncbi:hypothetical protein [Thalassobellus suaedae]|uniref:N-acetyltransferase domain-containing protein n=1 Tax=Thalassobellus suaedae TaxID=3074124 RepID=A0ABY9XVR0_9FLAO|nr:hypothetical protein RHP51_04890 [Flavobacteriaceae bacterium HL-DH14]
MDIRKINNLKIRLTTTEDYQELVSWWKWHRFTPPNIDMLPNSLKDGIMISINEINCCAGFIYRTPSSFCWCEYIVSNPEIKDKSIRTEALCLLINNITELARKMGFKIIFTSVKNQNLINKYQSCGYAKGTSTIEMIKEL